LVVAVGFAADVEVFRDDNGVLADVDCAGVDTVDVDGAGELLDSDSLGVTVDDAVGVGVLHGFVGVGM
jgi:hypothetical protein